MERLDESDGPGQTRQSDGHLSDQFLRVGDFQISNEALVG